MKGQQGTFALGCDRKIKAYDVVIKFRSVFATAATNMAIHQEGISQLLPSLPSESGGDQRFGAKVTL